MTDKEILDEVYRRLVDEKRKYKTVLPSPIISFIEQEWQKADELDDHPLTKSDEGQMYNINSADVAEIERHVGLEIDEDGTVKEIKHG
jgi:hypothetical protein